MRNLVTGYIEETRTQMKERQKKGELAPTYQYYAVPSDKCMKNFKAESKNERDNIL